jgi:Fe-S oxidoreductase
VYSPPRELLDVIPDADLKEMPRNSERSFCCGAGGVRMWMEETIGERINLNRTNEAVETGADQIATGCPFCRVMMTDGVTIAAPRLPKAEVLDGAAAAGLADTSSVTLPGRGTAQEAEKRSAKKAAEAGEGGSRDRRG